MLQECGINQRVSFDAYLGKMGSTLLFFLLFFFGCQPSPQPDQVCRRKQCVNVEIAREGEALLRGLQFRKSLGEKEGMLFIFPNEEKLSFWMKDTLIPLDIIWLDYSRTIVHVEAEVPPCNGDPCPAYSSSAKAMYVLEINAGHAARMGLKVGDRLEFRLREFQD
ncbi:MAG: DUF192 domain-containing protein [Candidatus Omnitrophota bacterium]